MLVACDTEYTRKTALCKKLFIHKTQQLCFLFVMRNSEKRHVISVLRLMLNEKQDGFHRTVGCSISYLGKIESMERPMTWKFASQVFLATGVSLTWLKRNDLSAPPTDIDGRPYTIESFIDWHTGPPTYRAS